MTDPTILSLAAYGLEGGHGPPQSLLGSDEWDELMTKVQLNRLSGLLGAAVAAGSFPTTASQAIDAELAHASAMEITLQLEALLLSVLELLAAAGVEYRLLKGPAAAHLDYPEPGWRCFGDIDVLVPSNRFADTAALFGREGWLRDLPERRPRFDGQFGKELCLRSPHGYELDLHRTLVLGAFGQTIRLDDLWERDDIFVLGGRSICALSTELRFVQACYGAVLSDPRPRLSVLRDLAQIANAHPLDLEYLEEILCRWRGAIVVQRAFRSCSEMLGPVLPSRLHEWARGLRSSTWQRAAVRAYTSQGGSNTATLLFGVMGIRGFGRRSSYLRALLAPSREYRRARRLANRPIEWRRGASELLSGRR